MSTMNAGGVCLPGGGYTNHSGCTYRHDFLSWTPKVLTGEPSLPQLADLHEASVNGGKRLRLCSNNVDVARRWMR